MQSLRSGRKPQGKQRNALPHDFRQDLLGGVLIQLD